MIVCNVKVNAAPPVYEQVRKVLYELKSTTYTHDIFIDERKGIYNLDCSGFADHILKSAHEKAADELESLSYPKRPLAKNFVEFFSQLQDGDGSHWQKIRYLRHLKLGDIVAWLIPPGSSSKDTGHVMIVTGAFRINPLNKNEYFVPVTDSASSGHGKQDPRRRKGPNGVGSGVIGLIADNYDRPIAFRWSGQESQQLKYTTIRMARTFDGQPQTHSKINFLAGEGNFQ